jgi:serine/threonine protein kinase
LGEGGYSIVYLVKDIEGDKEYALKRMFASSKEQVEDADSEINFMVEFLR